LESPSITSNLRGTRQWAILFVLGLSVLAYFPSLWNGFVNYDDIDERIFRNPFLHQPWQWSFIPTAFSQATAGYYDPIYVLSYVVDYQLWGMNPAGFHLGNLVLHTLNSLLVLGILWRLTGRFDLAWIAALVFAVHPVHVESVSWATSRKDTLSLFWILCAFWVYWRFRESASKQFIAGVLGSVGLFLLGMMTKPTVAVFPGMVLMGELLFAHRPYPWKRIAVNQVLAWSACLIFIHITFPMTMGIAVKETIHFSAIEQVTLFFELYAYFIKLILFPINLSALYMITVHDQIERVTLYVFIPVLLVLVGWMLWQIVCAVKYENHARRHAPLLWGAAVFFGGLLPYTNIMPRTIYLADRYEYLASIGFSIIVAELLLRFRSPVWRNTCLATVIFLYAVLTLNRVPVWKDSVTLWADVDKKMVIAPQDHHIRMAHAYSFQGQWREALKEYDQVDLVALRDPEAWLRVGRLHISAGQMQQARTIFNNLVHSCPDYVVPVSHLILMNISMDHGDQAVALLQRFEPLFLPEEKEYILQAIEFQKTGQHQEAAELLQKSNQSLNIRLAPVQETLVRQCQEKL